MFPPIEFAFQCAICSDGTRSLKLFLRASRPPAAHSARHLTARQVAQRVRRQRVRASSTSTSGRALLAVSGSSRASRYSDFIRFEIALVRGNSIEITSPIFSAQMLNLTPIYVRVVSSRLVHLPHLTRVRAFAQFVSELYTMFRAEL